jgi:hypothetical protein
MEAYYCYEEITGMRLLGHYTIFTNIRSPRLARKDDAPGWTTMSGRRSSARKSEVMEWIIESDSTTEATTGQDDKEHEARHQFECA